MMATTIGRSEEALDEKWFDRLVSIRAQVPTWLRPNNYSEARKVFLRGGSREPHFTYEKPQKDHIAFCRDQLHALQEELVSCATTPKVVVDLYLDKIDEKLHQFALLDTHADLLDASVDNETGTETFSTLSGSIYGLPTTNVFNHLMLRIQTSLQQMSSEQVNSDEYQRLQEVFGKVVETTVVDLTPIPAQQLGNTTYTDANQVKTRFEDALAELGFSDWSVKIRNIKKAGFSVWPLTKSIHIPGNAILLAKNRERVLTETALEGLIAHEIKTHVVRYESALSTPLRLLSCGLAGYLRGEEGLATYREQHITGADDYTNYHHYLAIGLAFGLDRDNQRRTFREVFEILRDYLSIQNHKTLQHFDSAAFLICSHVFKGATIQNPYLVFTRNVIYREGNIAVHQYMSENKVTDAFLNVGKYDPTNLKHVQALQQLGIISSH